MIFEKNSYHNSSQSVLSKYSRPKAFVTLLFAFIEILSVGWQKQTGESP